jgi:hydroxypyruvate isomerase
VTAGSSTYQYAANVGFLFADLPFPARFGAARDAGFEAVEFDWPTGEQLGVMTHQVFAAQVRNVGLKVGLFNLAGYDPAAGLHGMTAVPGLRDAFRAHVPAAIELAVSLGCKKIHALAGNVIAGISRESQLACLVENLTWAADQAAPAGIVMTLEALNPVDFPRYLVQSPEAALHVVHSTSRANVRFQLDVYHVAMIGMDPSAIIDATGPAIGHVQLADCPGRHEPGTGTLRFPDILAALRRNGYDDWIGLEYKPTDVTSRDFSFVERNLGGGLRTR